MRKVAIEAESFKDHDGLWRGRFHATKDGKMVVDGQTDEGRHEEEDALRDALLEGCRLSMFA